MLPSLATGSLAHPSVAQICSMPLSFADCVRGNWNSRCWLLGDWPDVSGISGYPFVLLLWILLLESGGCRVYQVVVVASVLFGGWCFSEGGWRHGGGILVILVLTLKTLMGCHL